MTLFFKKKKTQPALYTSLDIAMREALKNKKDCFFIGLLDGEEALAQAWCVKNRAWMDVSHRNGNTLVYKVWF